MKGVLKMKIKVIIEEVISQTFEVEVSDMSNAYEEVREKYRDGILELNNANLIESTVAFIDEDGEASDFVRL